MSTARERHLASISTSGDGHAPQILGNLDETANKAAGLTLGEVEQKDLEQIKVNDSHAGQFAPLSGAEFDRLKADIAERGILVPLIVKKDGTLLAGHNRREAARQLGLKSVPVQRLSNPLSDEQEKAFVIKDNLLRRQLTAEQKAAALKVIYGQEILAAKHGGSRKDTESGSRFTVNLAQKIAKETGIPTGTAKRYIADIRRTDSQRNTPSDRTGKAQSSAASQGKGKGRGENEKALRAFASGLNNSLKTVELENAQTLKAAISTAKAWIKDLERKHKSAEKAKL